MNASLHLPRRLAGICVWTNGLIIVFLAIYFLILPGFILIHDLMDPNLRRPGGIPKVVWRVHESLTPRYERWARERITSGRAGHLKLNDVPSTEWPMFGSVFYLAATENLQRAWDNGDHGSKTAPKVYARAAIETAADLIMDPTHHTWVQTHWGKHYMHRENVFFRAMLIQGLTARQILLGDGQHLDVLRDQVETLSAALDKSPFGWLDDYPGECYPVDVFAAITMIRRADALLGTDHSAFVARAIRGFQDARLDSRGLPPYFADPDTGNHDGMSRGVGNSYVCLYAPELYPDLAKQWYEAYLTNFWQEKIGAAGFREYSKELPGYEWFFDIDSGPVAAGFSPAGNAYAMAAARVNGRFDQAWPLAAQVLTFCWPLPDGSLLGPRILSNAAHAPYLGEANMLYLLSQNPESSQAIRLGGHIPPLVYGLFLFYFGLGILECLAAFRNLHTWKKTQTTISIPAEGFQCGLWVALILSGIVLIICFSPGIGILPVLFALLLPRLRPTRQPQLN
ncbi:MAG: hypothetical protein PHW60_09640 [Kiritimatiellae bacterium]|nr:hypothetical protein [Kiritimatiellia bacterium]